MAFQYCSEKDEFSEQAALLSERMESLAPVTEKESPDHAESKITFYVAECSEFPNLGEFHENLTLDEAIRIYHEIPSNRMNGVKGIGFHLEDGNMYDGQMDLMSGGIVHTDVINAIDHYRNNPEIQQAMEQLKTIFSVPEYEKELLIPTRINLIICELSRYSDHTQSMVRVFFDRKL